MATNNVEATDVNEELGKLRSTNRDLLEKKQTYKVRIAELEAENAALKTRSETAEQKIQAKLLDEPLDKLLRESAVIPSVLKSELLKRYKVELNEKDQIELHNLDNSPVIGKDGKPLPLTHQSLSDFLANKEVEKSDPESYRIFAHLLIGSRASGGGAGGSYGSSDSILPAKKDNAIKKTELSLGLR